MSSLTYSAMASKGLKEGLFYKKHPIPKNDLLDIDRGHVLKDASTKSFAVVWHGTVLQGSSKNNDIPSFSFHLNGIPVEVFCIIWVSWKLMGVWADSSTTIAQVEVGEESYKLNRQWGSGVHDVRVGGGVEEPVVGVIQMRLLTSLSGQNSVGCKAGDS